MVTAGGVEIDSLTDFNTQIGRTGSLDGWFVSSLDLRDRTDALLRVDPRGAVFLGCRFAEAPVDVAAGSQRPYDRPPYDESSDSIIYAWTRSPAGRTLTADLAAPLQTTASAARSTT